MELEKPEPSDCCGSGCSPCVFDIYEQRLTLLRTATIENEDECRRDLLSETRFKPFKLLHKERLTEDVYLYQFRPDIDGWTDIDIRGFLPYDIGQHLILRCSLKVENKESNEVEQASVSSSKTKDDSKQSVTKTIITRAYTPLCLSKNEKNCCFRVFAKLYRNGMCSKYLRNLQVGDITWWRGPYGKFKYNPNSFKYILMLCIGSGLAPMITVSDYILDNDSDETVIHLFYGVKSIEHIIMRDNLRRMTHYWNFSLEYYFSENKVDNDDMKFGEKFSNRRIDDKCVTEFIEGKDLQKLLILICGTDSFTSIMKNVGINLGMEEKNIFVF